jgi:hypothetical protein
MKKLFGHIREMDFLRLLVIAGTAVIIAGSCTFQGFAIRQSKKALKNGPYDVVIVAGVPYLDTVVNPSQIQRISWAKHLYDIGIAKNIIFSGAAVYTPFYEGIIMKTYADSMGVPSMHTFSETCAEHSVENIWYSLKMARLLGFKKVALAGDPFQTKLLMRFIRIRCPQVAVIPFTYKELRRINQQVPKINPEAARKKVGFVALPARQTKAQRYKGTRGRNINFSDTTDVAPCER